MTLLLLSKLLLVTFINLVKNIYRYSLNANLFFIISIMSQETLPTRLAILFLLQDDTYVLSVVLLSNILRNISHTVSNSLYVLYATLVQKVVPKLHMKISGKKLTNYSRNKSYKIPQEIWRIFECKRNTFNYIIMLTNCIFSEFDRIDIVCYNLF